jgi:hypothetical protein
MRQPDAAVPLAKVRTTTSPPITTHTMRAGGRGFVQPSLCSGCAAAKTLFRWAQIHLQPSRLDECYQIC